ncbi:hypothetical protein BDV38DRAFT_293768 [Aspergillus pseudotamarii]|uniref:Uncharacterized protein n=1 Tax=Aspergillus pseudotamarii TaxID=132259 RepID=A0A5N6SRY2_ASPPS|nr:uncharacterized protein BDV38DRAFT_293768 [Aspergillus pseudotamarii]KAE8136589.1 hypothetical protein BDV38DRAFT_293768 [Aspergillus pseudotamarii]
MPPSTHSHPPPPPPPPPRLPPYQPRGGAKAPVARKSSPPPRGSFGIGIEMELLLQSRVKPSATDNTFPRFARNCATIYNSETPSIYPRMHSLVQAQWVEIPHTQWVLHHDPTCETRTEPWGIEIISPGNADCSTHVHISRVEGFSTSDVKGIAQAIIHFQPAFEAVVPPARRGNEYSRSNWLDNPRFGYLNLSREQSIALLESKTTTDEIIDIMNPNQSKYFGWNFLSLKTFKTIEFRRGSASLSSDDAFMWVELTLSFMQAAMTHPSLQHLRRYPGTIGGLKDFIQHARLPQQKGAHNPAHLQRLFHNKDLNSRLDPTCVGHLSDEKQAKLQRKINSDAASNPMLDIISSAQQYGVA